jgi:hypothetical protein
MMPRLAVIALFLALLLGAAACDDNGGGNGGDGEEPTSEAPATEAPTQAPATAEATAGGEPVDLRSEDLTQQEGLQSFLTGSNGVVDPSRITYADLTEDGAEEAVVPVGSGGEGGDIAVFVYTSSNGPVEQLLRILPESGSLTAEVQGADLIVREPSFAEGDPMCCPSQLVVTTFRWNGDTLSQASQETVPAGG